MLLSQTDLFSSTFVIMLSSNNIYNSYTNSANSSSVVIYRNFIISVRDCIPVLIY